MTGISGHSGTRRPFSATQRLAPAAADRGCTFPGCSVPAAWCEIDHALAWSQGGPTTVADGLRPVAGGYTSGGITRDAGRMTERNVLGGDLEPCSVDPLTGFFRDGACRTGPEDMGSHTICAVVTAEFLEHQRSIGNDLSTPRPEYHFPGLVPGDRWCVTAVNWARAHNDGVAAPVVLASTNAAVLNIVPLEVLREYAVDVPPDLRSITS